MAELAVVPSDIKYTKDFNNIRQGMNMSYEIRPTIEAEVYDRTNPDAEDFGLADEDDVIDLI